MLLPIALLLSVIACCLTLDVSDDTSDEELVQANNAFACDLYGELRSREGNVLFSPYSIFSALAMSREGARGETARQMDRALHTSGESLAQPSGSLAAALEPESVLKDRWDRSAGKVPAYELSVANALWGQEGLSFEVPFLDALEKGFGAPLQRIDFRRSEEARSRINRWVEKNTKGRIQDIVPPPLPTPETLLALANAIHFKAQWEEQFRRRSTEDAPFAVSESRQVSVPMMRQVETHGYAELEGGQLLELAYRGAQTSMVILLPTRVDGLPELERRLNGDTLAGWLRSAKATRVAVQLPRFEFTTPSELLEPLRKLGMEHAFDVRQADFRGMTGEVPLFIGAVLHKAFIAVDEEGTEAAAATVAMALGAADMGEPVSFVADHPFLFMIRHRPTGCILFLGRVVDPS